VVCFSETPLEHIYSLYQEIPGRSVRLSPYGIAFTKAVARDKGANPIWYVDQTPGHTWEISDALNSLQDLAVKSGDFGRHPASKVLPFIEQMGDWRSAGGTIKEFSWEREWRHRGSFVFFPSEVALVLCPDDEIAMYEKHFDCRAIDPKWSLERMVEKLAKR
jgi:hypothetical protein